jgi:hypothetical protein
MIVAEPESLDQPVSGATLTRDEARVTVRGVPDVPGVSHEIFSRVSAGNVTVEGNVAGHDVIQTTTNVGYSAAAVQRLLLTVGGLVFVTAFCFFSAGVLVAGTVAAVIGRSVEVSQTAAQSMQASIDALSNLPAGTPFQQTFTEAELNSYWELVVGPQIGLKPGTGAARLLGGDNRLALAGQFAALGNFKVLAVVDPLVNVPGQLFKVDSAAIQVVPLGNTSLGWVPFPAAALQPMVDNVNKLAGARVDLTGVSVSGSELTVNGVGR